MPAPTTPGDFVGQANNGYFWNGTSWDQGETTSGTPAPGGAFGGTIINQQNAKPPAPPTSAAKRASILATIMRVESGGKNIPQSLGTRDVNNNYGQGGGDPAQGFYQITNGTWAEHGGDKTGHKSALDAPYATQLQIAQNIPVARWGPATQEALKAAGYAPQPGETLGQMLQRYQEDAAATRPEDVGGSSSGGGAPQAPQPYAPPPGLLAAPAAPDLSAATQAAADAASEKKKSAAYADAMKSGMGLLAQATTAAPPFMQAPALRVPQPQAPPLPDFNQVLAQQRLLQRGGV